MGRGGDPVSSVAYWVTKDVRHLAAWTRDHSERWDGRFRAICGGAAKGRLEWTHLFTDDRSYGYAMRRPICRRCLKVAQAMAALIEHESEAE